MLVVVGSGFLGVISVSGCWGWVVRYMLLGVRC